MPGVVRLRVALLVLVPLALTACQDDNVYSSGGDPASRRAAEAVVTRNVTALERGDGRAYCATYTPRFIEEYHNTRAGCRSRFEARPRARPPAIDFTGFYTATDDRVSVSFTTAGPGNEQTYYLERVGGRWLIGLEAVARD